MYPRIHIGSLEIGSYLLCGFAALAVSVYLVRRELSRNRYPRHLWIVLACVGIPAGLLGSKVYDVLEKWDLFVLSPYELFFRMPGQGWYGAFLSGSAAIALALWMMKLPVLRTFDLAAPVIPLGHALGRLGCFLSGCCHGIPSTASWALSFPGGQYPPEVPVHPTQLYEMLAYLCISVLLWKLRDQEITDGVRFGLYLVLAGLARFVTEFYRLNPKVLPMLTFPQLLAIAGIVLGSFLMMNTRRGDIRTAPARPLHRQQGKQV
jgi:phosphatidylglycerol:prolipoprotein diacylglycerol transferase